MPLAAFAFDEMVTVLRLGEEHVAGKTAVCLAFGLEHKRTAQAIVDFQAMGMDVFRELRAGDVDARPADPRHAADAVFGQREEVQLVGRAEAVRRFRRALADNRAVRKLGLSFHRRQV